MRLSTILLLVITGCDDDSIAESRPPEQGRPTQSEVASAAVEAERALPEESARDVARERARADAVIVRQARTAARAGEFAEAYRLMQGLVQRTPRGPRVHCTAGFYAHRAGNTDAARLLDVGLHLHGPLDEVREPMRAPLAMCLFNRGLVHEANDERERAASLYRASISLRPNVVVERHLNELGNVPAVEYRARTAQTRPEFPERAVGTDLASVLSGLAPRICEAAIEEPDFSTARDPIERPANTCHFEPRALPAEGDGPRVQFVVFQPRGGGEYEEVGYLAIDPFPGSSEVVVLGPIVRTDYTVQGPVFEPPAKVEWLDIDDDGKPELIIEHHLGVYSSEEGCSDSEDYRSMDVFRNGERGWESRSFALGSRYGEMCYVEQDEESEGEDSSSSSEEGLYDARLTVPEGGGLLFRDGDVEMKFTLDELFERCDGESCSLEIAAGLAGR